MQNNKINELLTIIIPFYNSKDTIVKTLQSITNQSSEIWKVILVNDGSTDESSEIIKVFIEDFKNKIEVVNQKNSGQSKARDNALSYVKTDWVMYLDSDDLLEPDVLSIIEDTLKLDFDVILMDYVDEYKGQTKLISNSSLKRYTSSENFIELLQQKKRPSVFCSNLIYKTNHIIKNNLKFSISNKLNKSNIKINYMQGEEIMFATLALYTSKKIHYIEHPLARYMRNNLSITFSFNYSRLGAFYNNLYIVEYFKNQKYSSFKLIRDYYYRGALNGLIYNFYIMKTSFDNKNSDKISYKKLIKNSKKIYPTLIRDYRRIAISNLCSVNILKLSSILNILFGIFPVFVLKRTTNYFKNY